MRAAIFFNHVIFFFWDFFLFFFFIVSQLLICRPLVRRLCRFLGGGFCNVNCARRGSSSFALWGRDAASVCAPLIIECEKSAPSAHQPSGITRIRLLWSCHLVTSSLFKGTKSECRVGGGGGGAGDIYIYLSLKGLIIKFKHQT